MTWQYQVEWYPEGDVTQENVIIVESKPRKLGSFGLIEVNMWTSSDFASDRVTDQYPLALYVKVTRGDSPVLEAHVEVDVLLDLGNGTEIKIGQPLTLFDKGNGGKNGNSNITKPRRL